MDGLQFSHCFNKAMNLAIEDFKKFALKYPQNTKYEASRICDSFSVEDQERIKYLFVEWDEENKRDVPYDSEDMLLINISELTYLLAEKVTCYKNYNEGTAFIEKIVNSVPKKRNLYLVESALSKMTKEKSPKDSGKSLGDVNLSFCKI